MKLVIIIIRPSKYFETKNALKQVNIPSLSIKDILGRGRTKVAFEAGDGSRMTDDSQHPFVAKKMLEIYCRDEEVDMIISTVLKINQSGKSGDGRIFVLDVDDGVRIRTEERNVNAIM